MHTSFPTRTLLAGTLAAMLAFGASAQSATDGAKHQELEAARAELQRAAKRVAELSRGPGGVDDGVFVFQQRALSRPVLGVLLDADDTRGVQVSGVTPASGAARAGLRAGDRITGIDGQAVAGANAAARLERLRAMLAGLEAGKAVRVGYERDGRAATVSVTPEAAPSVAFFGGDGSEMHPRGNVRFIHSNDGRMEIEADAVDIRPAPGEPLRIEREVEDGAGGRRIVREVVMPRVAGDMRADIRGIAPDVHREIIRLSRDGACREGSDCRTVALSEAFRWNGLNLASVDAQLGRYFGADSGVLVVSAGPELGGLKSGDVIRRVDGKAVTSPREVMDQLRGRPEGSMVAVDVLRDRKAVAAQLKAPKALRIPLPPPPPPAPPAPPAPPSPGAPPAPPAPPAAAGIAATTAPRAVAPIRFVHVRAAAPSAADVPRVD